MTLLNSPLPVKRSRVRYAGLVVLIVALGLLSRHYRLFLPFWLAKNAGAVLWALCVYLVFGWLRPAAPVQRVVVLALLFSYAIDGSELYHAPWIDALRRTPLGLLLGYGSFHWSNLLCYTLGIALGTLGEWGMLATARHRVCNASPQS